MNEQNPESQQAEEAAQDEFNTLQDRFLRLAAEFDNFKKRSERDKQIALKFANESLLVDLLPVLDHLEQAVMASASNADAMIIGVKMVLKQFEDVLGRYGIKSLSALGENFDPSKHEAVLEQEDAEGPAGRIIQEYQKAYWLNDRLIRAARVVVSKATIV